MAKHPVEKKKLKDYFEPRHEHKRLRNSNLILITMSVQHEVNKEMNFHITWNSLSSVFMKTEHTPWYRSLLVRTTAY